MTDTFRHLMVNGGFGDPALHLQFTGERRALLFDLGELTRLCPAEILKVTDVFVSHTHIDHFVGFDRLLRVVLNREKTVRVFGPEGIIRNVAGKLAGYTWNLVDDYRLRFQVHELSPGIVRRVTFSCKDRFRTRSASRSAPFDGVILEEDQGEVLRYSRIWSRIASSDTWGFGPRRKGMGDPAGLWRRSRAA